MPLTTLWAIVAVVHSNISVKNNCLAVVIVCAVVWFRSGRAFLSFTRAKIVIKSEKHGIFRTIYLEKAKKYFAKAMELGCESDEPPYEEED